MSGLVQLIRGTLVLLLFSALSCPIYTHAVAGASENRKPSPENSELAQAEALLQQGRVAEAKASTVEYLGQHSSSVEGYNLLGVICGNARDYEGALDAFQHALKLNPSSTKSHNNLGNLYAAAGKTDLAEKEFRTSVTLAPSDSEANYNLALLLISRGKPADAILRLQRVRPATLEARMNLVRAYLRADRVPEGLELAKALSAQDASDVQRHLQYKIATAELEKADALKPGTFEILYNLGQTYLREKEFAKSEVVLNRALKLKPDSADTMYLLAQILNDESRPVDALDLLARAHKLAPENPDIIFLLARVSMGQNYFEDAIPLLESGLKIAPQRAELRAALGESYFMSGKTDKAIEEFKKLIALEPSARSYTFMGLSYRHLGRFDEARKYFDEALKREPTNAACLFNIGFIDERQGNTASTRQPSNQGQKVCGSGRTPSALCERFTRPLIRLLQTRHGGTQPPSDGRCRTRPQSFSDAFKELDHRALSIPASF